MPNELMPTREFFREAVQALERGERLRDIRPFRALAAAAVGRRARLRPELADDLAQELLTYLVTARRLRSSTWRAFLACDEKTLVRRLQQFLRWRRIERGPVGAVPSPLDELDERDVPAADEDVERSVRREIDGGRLARRLLPLLTARERRVVELWAQDPRAVEVARAVGVSRATVYEIIRKVREKLDDAAGEGGRRRKGRLTSSRGTRGVALRELLTAITATAPKKGGGA